MSRRTLLHTAAATCVAGAAVPMPAEAKEPRTITVAQIVDMSPQHLDVSRDVLTGSRAAWAELNARDGGIRGQAVQHLVLEIDGSPQSVRTAWQAARDNPACVALSGCAGDGVAATITALQSGNAAMAQVAPWLHRQCNDEGDTLFNIFPGYQAQITHAIQSLAVMGVRQTGVVFASAALQQLLEDEVAAAGKAAALRIQPLPATGQYVAAQSIVLFVGGTPELHAYLRRLALPQGRHCYVVALADVNLQVLAQLGGIPRNISVVATQSVPLVSHGIPVVRAYRDALARLYDEPPSSQGLAGFIAARYTAEVLGAIPGPIARAGVLAAFRRRGNARIGGYLVAYQGRKLISTQVTQSMLTTDGRIVG